MTNKRGLLFALLFSTIYLAQAPEVRADDYPSRRVTIIVPHAAGGGVDIIARMLAAEFQEKFGQSFVVENRVGGGTLIGAGVAANAKPDGYTLLVSTVTTLAINSSIYKSLPYDPIKSFEPISLLAGAPFVLAVNPAVKANTLKELITLAKNNPDQLTYASAGPGTAHHLYAELFKSMADVKIRHVPYKGGPPGLSDVVAGEVSMIFSDVPPALPRMKEGKLRFLAVTPSKRIAALPDVPTLSEAGLPGYSAVGWLGLVGPRGMPKETVDKLNAATRALLSKPELAARLRDTLGMEVMTNTPQEFAKYIPSEIETWGKVVKAAGIEPQ